MCSFIPDSRATESNNVDILYLETLAQKRFPSMTLLPAVIPDIYSFIACNFQCHVAEGNSCGERDSIQSVAFQSIQHTQVKKRT